MSYYNTSATGTSAIATSIAVDVGVNRRLVSVMLALDAVPVTAGNLTITLNALEGSDYDTVVGSVDPSSPASTSVLFTCVDWGDLILVGGDAIDVAYANADSRTYGLRIITADAG